MQGFDIVLIAHDLRSAHNIGALFRIASGVGVSRIYLTGHSPAPAKEGKLYPTAAEKSLAKTALGAEKEISFVETTLDVCFAELRQSGYAIVALEQHETSVDYREHLKAERVALLVGNEPEGIDPEILIQVDQIIEIPMLGKKNSLNVSVAAGIALYRIREGLEGKAL